MNIKEVKDTFKLFKVLRRGSIDLGWFQIVEAIMKFAEDVQKHRKPMLTKITSIDMGKEHTVGNFDIVSIWAGVGDANPIERIRHLKAQNTALKELLEQSISYVGVNDTLILNIKIALDNFE